jgi:hypothetical protein
MIQLLLPFLFQSSNVTHLPRTNLHGGPVLLAGCGTGVQHSHPSIHPTGAKSDTAGPTNGTTVANRCSSPRFALDLPFVPCAQPPLRSSLLQSPDFSVEIMALVPCPSATDARNHLLLSSGDTPGSRPGSVGSPVSARPFALRIGLIGFFFTDRRIFTARQR